MYTAANVTSSDYNEQSHIKPKVSVTLQEMAVVWVMADMYTSVRSLDIVYNRVGVVANNYKETA